MLSSIDVVLEGGSELATLDPRESFYTILKRLSKIAKTSSPITWLSLCHSGPAKNEL